MAQRKFIIDGGFKTDDASELLADLTMGGSILPNVNSDGTTGYDLGSSSMKWKDLYLSAGSLYINNQKVLQDDSGTIVVSADEDQGMTVKVTGTGVLALQSATTVNMNGTLQMASGKNITDAAGVAVGLGDKIDMNSNLIINVGAAVSGSDAANKTYVDGAISDLVNGAPGAMDTLNELANALGDDANFSTTVTNSIAANTASIVTANTNIASNVADIATNAAGLVTANTALTTKANTTYVDAQNLSQIAVWEAHSDASEAAAIATAAADATSKANAAQAAAIADSDAADVVVTTAYTVLTDAATTDRAAIRSEFAAADTAQTSSINSAWAAADTAQTSSINTAWAAGDAGVTTAMQTYADTAEADAISTAAGDATTKANAAQAAAEATASADATSKVAAEATIARAAESANATAIGVEEGRIDAIMAGSTADKDTFAEIVSLINTVDTTNDGLLATEIANRVSGDAAVTAAMQTYADQAEADAESAAASDATTKADAALAAAKVYADANDANDNTTYTAGNGMTLSGTEFLMSGSYTGSFTATGDITAYSDDSLKTNVQVIDGALGRVEAIRGVTFERIEDGSVSTGVIAQELKAVLPEAVHTDANGVHSVAYGNITGLLIEAVKELSAQVAELKAK